MSEQKTCPVCQELFFGRANQAYCSNAHKAIAFRERRWKHQQRILAYEEPTHIYFYSQAYPSQHLQVCQELNDLQTIHSQAKALLGLEGEWPYQELKDYLQQQIDDYRRLLRFVENTVIEEKYSLRYRQFMGSELEKLPSFFRLVLATLRAMRRNLLKSAPSGEVEAEIGAIAVKKLQQWQEKYRQRWFNYRGKYLL